MPLEFSIDLTGETPESIEAGTQTPPGWYHARLEDVYDDEKNPGVMVFKYKVIGGNGGAWTDRFIFDRIGEPDQAESENAADFIRRRMKLLAKRLGLITDEQIKAGGQLQLNWYDAMNKEFVLHVKQRTYDEKDKATGQKTGQKRTVTGVDFAGVYPIGYQLDKLPKGADQCPTDMRQVLGGGQAPAGGPATTAPVGATTATQAAAAPPPATAPAGQPAFDFSDM